MKTSKLNALATDKIMSLAELKEDNLFGKIPKKLIPIYIDKSMNIGINAAKDFKEEYRGKTPDEICVEKRISLNFIKSEPKLKFITIRAEYLHHNRQLNIYNHSIEEMEKQFKNSHMDFTLNKKDIVNIHIVHELFHFLEYEEIGLTNEKMEKVQLYSLFSRKREGSIISTREIAAHMFCKEFLNLKIHPKWMDYMYLLASSELNYDELEDYLKKLNQEISMYYKNGREYND